MIENVTLEMSLKPFKQLGDEYITEVCRRAFTQWRPLLRGMKTVSVLLWAADGSEILDYRAKMDESFEWADKLGGANPREGDHSAVDPDGIGLHSRNYLYMKDPPRFTYGDLRRVVSHIKSVGREMFPNAVIRVGETFDPGPEFARSSFKYERHNEICMGNAMGKGTMVCAYARLHADNVRYATYPDGIPEGTPFGEFFGRQSEAFLRDLGFDYLWLSNGFGFGRETWSTVGAVFDGEKFDGGGLEKIKDDVRGFWKLFRENCPDYPVETRGTNMTMGIDLASDGVPLREIYDGGYDVLPPPNSPWAAINGDFGLELAGYMSRVAYLADDRFLFRYYVHDPWWANSPWYDRYNGRPHDIYLPLACSRVGADGSVKTPTHMNFLSIDNSWGELPDSCAEEPIPHIKKAIKDSPDDIPPVVWVYPFSEYSDETSEDGLRAMFSGDWFVRGAINNGFPLSGVVSTDNFARIPAERFADSVLFTPVPDETGENGSALLDYAERGGRVIFYGPASRMGERALRLLGLRAATGVTGELAVKVCGETRGTVKIGELACAGGLDAVSDGCTVIAEAGGRVLASARGNAGYLRGAVSCDYVKGSPLLVPHDASRYFIAETLANAVLARLGWEISFAGRAGAKSPVVMLSRSDNALLLSAYVPDTTVETRLRAPLGAPVATGYETELINGRSSYRFPKSEHVEIRAFVEQDSGVISCRELPPVSAQYRRRIGISGLNGATVRFFGEKYCENELNAVLNSVVDNYFTSDPINARVVTDDHGTYLEVSDVTGELVVSMPSKR